MVAAIKSRFSNSNRLPYRSEPKEYSQFVYFLIYNRGKILFMLIASLLFMSMFTVFSAYCAKTWADYGGANPPQDVGGMLGLLVDEGGWIDQIVGANKATEYENLLKISASGGNFSIGGVDSLGTLYSIVKKANDLIVPVAWGLALIFWGYEFADMLMQSNGQLIVEQVIKKLAFLVVAFYVIKDSMTFCGEIIDAGTTLTSMILGGIRDVKMSDGTVESFKKLIFESCWAEYKIAGLFDFTTVHAAVCAIGFVVSMFLPWLITKVGDLIVRILCWSRAVEIFIFIAISPIMFIDLGTTKDLTHSSTARACKNLMALAMQGALILISISICQAILEGILTTSLVNNGTEEFMNEIWKLALIAILQVSTISKTNSVAKQALGV